MITCQCSSLSLKRYLFRVILTVSMCFFGLAPAPAQIKANYPEVYTMSPTGVNMQTGSYIYSEIDIEIGDLKFVRSWGQPAFVYSDYRDPHNFGSWTHNFGFAVSDFDAMPISGTMADIYSEGSTSRHSLITTNIWEPWSNDAQGTHLTQNAAGYQYTNRSGDQYTFSNNRLATRLLRADGSELIFRYNGSQRLTQIISNRGYAIILDYTAGRVSRVCGYNMTLHYITASTSCASEAPETSVTYGYTQKSHTYVLSSVTDQNGDITTMEYDNVEQPNLLCVHIPNTQTCQTRNYYEFVSWPHKVSRQVTATGEEWKFGYAANYGEFNPDGPPQVPGQTWTSSAQIQEPDGFFSSLTYANGFLSVAVLRTGTTEYEWEGTSIKKYVLPRGNQINLVRDPRGNIIQDRRRAPSGVSDPDILATATFPATSTYPVTGCASVSAKLCNKPVSSVDARGEQTDYTYHSSGAISTETRPSINGVRPQVRYTYEERYAWVKNSSGGFSSMTQPIWLLVRKSECREGAATSTGCALAGTEVVTQYDYGALSGQANTLQLRSMLTDASGLSLQTCYSYDVLGRKLSETTPKAGTCP